MKSDNHIGIELAEHQAIVREAAERGISAGQVSVERAALAKPEDEQPKELRAALDKTAEAERTLQQAREETSSVIAYWRERELLTAKVAEIKGKIVLAEQRFAETIFPESQSVEFIAGQIGEPTNANRLAAWALESLASKESARLKPLVLARLKQDLTAAENTVAEHIKDQKNASKN